jgi:HSP20 family protein
MPHFKIDPLKELESLSQRMKKFVDDFPDQFSIEFGGRFEPKADITFDETTVSIIVEIPGVRKEDIAIVFENGVLSLSGMKADDAERSQKTTLRSERSFGAFKRTFELPFKVRQDSAHTSLKDGLLSISFLKQTEEQKESITINIEE